MQLGKSRYAADNALQLADLMFYFRLSILSDVGQAWVRARLLEPEQHSSACVESRHIVRHSP